MTEKRKYPPRKPKPKPEPLRSGVDIKAAVPDFPTEADRIAWQHRACMAIALGEPGWDEIQPREGDDSDPMKAVRLLRAMYEAVVSDPRRPFQEITLGDNQKLDDLIGEDAAARYLLALWEEAEFHKRRGEDGYDQRIRIMRYLAEVAIDQHRRTKGHVKAPEHEQDYDVEPDLSGKDEKELEAIARGRA